MQPAIAPVGESRSNQDMFRELGVRLGQVEDDDLGEAGALMAATSRMREPLATALSAATPAPAPAGGHPVQFADVMPATANGRIDLFPAAIGTEVPIYTYQPDPATRAYPLCLITPASEHTISSTLGELRPGIVKVKLHPDDAHPRSIAEGDPVRIFNASGEVHCEASVSPEICAGTMSLPKGLWARSTFNGSTANALVPDTLTDIAGGACFNDARVQVELRGRH